MDHRTSQVSSLQWYLTRNCVVKYTEWCWLWCVPNIDVIIPRELGCVDVLRVAGTAVKKGLGFLIREHDTVYGVGRFVLKKLRWMKLALIVAEFPCAENLGTENSLWVSLGT